MPDAAASNSARFEVAPRNCLTNGFGSSPAMANPAFWGGGGADRSVRIAASTVGLAEIAAPKTSSWRGMPSRIGASSAASSSASTASATSGDVRSGSEKRISKATTAAPCSARRLRRSAMATRDHGHWPTRSSEASSMSTTRTGRFGSYSAGFISWYESKAISLSAWTKNGSA